MLPVIKELAGQGLTVSIDTMHAEVAQAALENGAQIVNDVSGGRADADMAPVVADAEGAVGADALALGRAPTSARGAAVRDVVAEVRAELLAAVDAAVAAGVDPANLIIDPGLGFAKTGEHNWALLRALPEFVEHRNPGARRGVAQAIPRDTARRRRRQAPPAGRPRDRDRGDLRSGRHARRVGGAGARRAGVGRRAEGRRGVDEVGERWLIESNCAA